MSFFDNIKQGLLQKALEMVDLEEAKQKFVNEGSEALTTYLEEKGLSPDMSEHLVSLIKSAVADSGVVGSRDQS